MKPYRFSLSCLSFFFPSSSSSLGCVALTVNDNDKYAHGTNAGRCRKNSLIWKERRKKVEKKKTNERKKDEGILKMTLSYGRVIWATHMPVKYAHRSHVGQPSYICLIFKANKKKRISTHLHIFLSSQKKSQMKWKDEKKRKKKLTQSDRTKNGEKKNSESNIRMWA